MPQQPLQVPESDPVRSSGPALVGDRALQTDGRDGIHADDLATARVIRGTAIFARLGVRWLHERNGR